MVVAIASPFPWFGPDALHRSVEGIFPSATDRCITERPRTGRGPFCLLQART